MDISSLKDKELKYMYIYIASETGSPLMYHDY